MLNLLLKNARKAVLFFVFLFVFSISFGQIDCPLNTPIMPFENVDDFSDEYAWSSNLYLPIQVGGAQTFNQISFRMDNHFSPGYSYTYSDFRIYIRHTTVNDFSASDPNYPGTAGFTLCYSGPFTINNPGVYTFALSTPFVYNGTDNFEVMFQNHGVDDNTFDDDEEPWYDRTNARTDGVHPGKAGVGSTWAGATSNFQTNTWPYNLQINTVGCDVYPLPVELASSNLSCDKNLTTINWETASEKNNDYFTISYSEDGKNWRPVKTIDGAGNSTESISYEEVLSFQTTDVSYFRLSQTDFDGTTEVLNTFTANCGSSSVLKSYPNPADDKLYISSSENLIEAKIELYDLKGNLYETIFSPTSKNSGEIDINHLASGVYTLRVTTNAVQEVVKVVKR